VGGCCGWVLQDGVPTRFIDRTQVGARGSNGWFDWKLKQLPTGHNNHSDTAQSRDKQNKISQNHHTVDKVWHSLGSILVERNSPKSPFLVPDRTCTCQGFVSHLRTSCIEVRFRVFSLCTLQRPWSLWTVHKEHQEIQISNLQI
jgi:hypothetical protein